MPRITIDNTPVEVPAGTTILHAARKLGLQIPTLCYYEGAPGVGAGAEASSPSAATDGCPSANGRRNASCMVCVVRLLAPNGSARLVPSCATRAEEGMQIASEAPDVHDARKAALELLLSDHVGDCMSPCHRVCPAHMNIPRMIRQIEAGLWRDALVTVKEDIALPAILGYICPAPCEKGCRRAEGDGPVAVCLLKRHVAEVDLATPSPYVPACAPASGQRVAIVGSGPAGLAAAYHLQQLGHAAMIFDDHDEPGGSLRYAVGEDRLPRKVLDGEIGLILRMGAKLEMRRRLGADMALDELRQQFDAVLVATGAPPGATGGLPASVAPALPPLKASLATFATAIPGVFAAGAVLRPGRWAVRSLAEGKGAAVSIDQFLRGKQVTGPFKEWSCRIGKITPQELSQFMSGVSPQPRHAPSGQALAGFTAEQAIAEARRCLHCDCRKADGCKLRQHAERYHADANRYASERRPVELRVEHPFVVFEPGKCIRCGICIQIAAAAKEELGLTFVGRGFNVRVAAPFNHALSEGMRQVAEQCVRACPTAAMAFRDAR